MPSLRALRIQFGDMRETFGFLDLVWDFRQQLRYFDGTKRRLLPQEFLHSFIDCLGGQSGRGFGDDNDARRNKDIFEL